MCQWVHRGDAAKPPAGTAMAWPLPPPVFDHLQYAELGGGTWYLIMRGSQGGRKNVLMYWES